MLSIKPSSYLDYHKYFKDIYAKLKSEMGGYTYVTFTSDLGLGECNTMLLIIQGKRLLTTKVARTIASSMNLKGVERRYLMRLAEMESLTDEKARDKAFSSLLELKAELVTSEGDKNKLEFFSNWYNVAIFELLSYEDASDDPEWISKVLVPSVVVTKVKKSLDLLQNLNYLAFDEDKKRLVPTTTSIDTGDEVSGLAVLSYHKQMIKLAKDSILRVRRNERYISSVTVSVSAKKFDSIKDKINKLQDEIIKLSEESEEKEDVIQVNFQMFPLAKPERSTQRGSNNEEK